MTARRNKAIDWIESKTAHSGQVPKVSIDWKNQAGYRADATRSEVKLGNNDKPAVIVHELGHHLEWHVPGVKKAAQEFLDHRCGSERPQRLAAIAPRGGYADDEVGRGDDFGKTFGREKAFYVGKTYKDGSTEIVSMGVEKLYQDPVGFAQTDPEYCSFIVGILDGSLRKP
jgi:hypothetical protein